MFCGEASVHNDTHTIQFIARQHINLILNVILGIRHLCFLYNRPILSDKPANTFADITRVSCDEHEKYRVFVMIDDDQ
jgi:hypothetical protein